MGASSDELFESSWPYDYLAHAQVATFEEASERLQELKPNAPAATDLSPSDMSPEMLATIVDHFQGYPPLRTKRSEYHTDQVALEHVVPGVGTLKRVGAIEHSQKICYQLTTPDGKQVAVLVVGYQRSLGMQVPQDPYLTVISDSPLTRLHEYAELRTYFVAPISDTHGVMLQEWGGENLESGHRPLGLATLARMRTQRRLRAIPGRAPRYVYDSNRELAHDRNLLIKPGYILPLAIDIPVVQCIPGAEQDF